MDSKDLDLLTSLDLAPEDTLAAERLRAATSPPFVAYERDLTAADLAALDLPKASAPPQALARIRSSHHSLARCLAAGMRPYQAALVTGYSAGHIAGLQRDPAFQALVADYSAEVRSAVADLAARMADVSLDALEILHERLRDDPASFSIPMLLDTVKAFADRTGYGPGSEVHVKMDHGIIDRPPRESFEEWEARRGRELKLLN